MSRTIKLGRLSLAVPSNVLDRAIETVAPVWGARRLHARLNTAMALGGYNGARSDRRSMAAWNPLQGDADTDSLHDLPVLRGRSRDLARNSPVAGGAINTAVTNVVGTGLALQSRIDHVALGMSEDDAAAWQVETQREFALWADSVNASHDRRLNFFGLQDLAFRSTLESGDVLVMTPEIERFGVPYRLAVQLVEADRVCNPNRAGDTPRITAGVEFGQHGEPARYHVCRTHPGAAFNRIGALQWDAIDAWGGRTGRRNAWLLMEIRRIGQTRGVPYLAPVIEPLKQLERYTEAELMAAVVSGMFTVFIKSEGEASFSAETLGQGPSSGGPGVELGNGLVAELAPGEDIQTANPGRPNAQFDPFVQSIIRQVGMQLQIPYEVLIKHFTASYSAARAALLDAWRFFKCRRSWLVDNFCQPLYEVWLDEAVACGTIVAPGYFADVRIRKAFTGAEWVGDGMPSLNPVYDVTAAKERCALGISTRAAESLLHDGIDWETKHRQLAREQRLREQDGLLQLEKPSTTA